MAQNLASSLVENIVPESLGNILILLVDHDTTSAVCLTSMLEQFSYKVVNVNEASKAVLMIEKQKKNIGLVIANIEMPQIDSHSFHTVLLQKDIPLILINPEKVTKKISDILTKRACFCLNKPISKDAIKNLWQHVSHKKSPSLENVMDDDINHIEAFRETLKRQRTSQASLLGRHPFIETFKTPETFPMRRNKANGERKTKLVCQTEIDTKRKEKKKMESNFGIRYKWTIDHHMKFLGAIIALGEKNSCPMAILRIMNEDDPDVTYGQVQTYLKKYKDQVERINAMPRIEWKSTDKASKYLSNSEYLFKASNLLENFVSNNSSSSSTSQFSTIKLVEEKNTKYYLGGILYQENHPFFNSYVPSPIRNNPPYNISPTDDYSHSFLNSAGLSSKNPYILSGLPSNISATNPNPFQPPSSLLETDRNQMNLDPTSILDAYDPQVDQDYMGESYNVIPDYTMNPFESNINHIDWISSTEGYVFSQTNLNIISPQANTNNLGWISSGERVIPPETKIPISQDNINYLGSRVSSETTHVVVESVKPREANVEDTNLVGYDESYEESIEDLILFDNNVIEMDMQSCFGNYGSVDRSVSSSTIDLSHDFAFNTPTILIPNIITEGQDHSFAMDLRSTNQHHTNIERESNSYNDREWMDWIEEILNTDA